MCLRMIAWGGGEGGLPTLGRRPTEIGIHMVGTYIRRKNNTVSDWVTTRKILYIHQKT